jgi:hypothetical protein
MRRALSLDRMLRPIWHVETYAVLAPEVPICFACLQLSLRILSCLWFRIVKHTALITAQGERLLGLSPEENGLRRDLKEDNRKIYNNFEKLFTFVEIPERR